MFPVLDGTSGKMIGIITSDELDVLLSEPSLEPLVTAVI